MNETLHNALNEISDRHIAAADGYRKHRRYPYWFGAVAAVLAVVIVLGIALNPSHNGLLVNQVAAAEYPQSAQHDQPEGYADGLTSFFTRSAAEFLSGEENQVYSPLNVYMALAMLAETTNGSSRRQILELLGAASIDQLRSQAGHVWNAHYNNDGETTSILANSLWLDQEFSYHRSAVDTLAESYYASTFCGDLGTAAMDRQLRAWLNNQTGGLLKKQTQNLKLSPSAVLSLVSTVFFRANWAEKFDKEDTKKDIFHGSNGDVKASFMSRTLHNNIYFRGANFGAVYLELTGSNKMWLILPDEGVTVAEVLEHTTYLDMVLDPSNWSECDKLSVNLRLPKFDVTGQLDLAGGIKDLGVTDVFDASVSDFSQITDQSHLYLNRIDHSARISIDEEGVVAAGYAENPLIYMGFTEVNFVLDRPFLFVVSSRDDLPLFVGTVQEP